MQAAPTAPYTLVTDAAGLSTLATAVTDFGGPIGVDTETTGLDSRTDAVRLIQLAVGGAVYLVDLFAFRAEERRWVLVPLFVALGAAELVAHNAQFDVRMLAALGFVPGRVYDTMLASQVLYAGVVDETGARLKHGLAAVVSRELCGVLAKGEQTSNWGRPALTPAQLAYAAADVRPLVPLADALGAKLAAANLTGTAALEMTALLGVAWAAPVAVDGAAWGTEAAAQAAEAMRVAGEMDEMVPVPGSLEGMSSRKWGSVNEVKAAFAQVGVALTRTDDDALATVDHPLAALVRAYRAAAHRVKSFGAKWLRDHAAGGTVLASWKQIGRDDKTISTGRMSCSDPSLHQIPRESVYRRCFVARPGRVLVRCDFSQIELRVGAKISGDAAMLAVYAAAGDLHATTAAAIMGVPPDRVTKAMRQAAKSVNFGMMFGQGPAGLVRYAKAGYGVDLTADRAASYRAAFFRAYPGFHAWYRRVCDRVDAAFSADPGGVLDVRTLGGRRRVLGVAKRPKGRDPYPNRNEALNSPIQGSAGDGMKAAIGLLWERRAECPGAVPLLFVHDEIVVEAPAESAAAAAAWLRRCMVDGMAPLLSPVPVEVEATVGRSWGGD